MKSIIGVFVLISILIFLIGCKQEIVDIQEKTVDTQETSNEPETVCKVP